MDKQTHAFYASTAQTYVASGANGTSRHLLGFLARLPAGARILELGCGGGRDAEAMLTAGFDVDATDGTQEVAAQAETRLARPVRVMRFDQLDAVRAYDAVFANASLLHVPRPDLPDVLTLVYRALRPGGLFFASYKSGGVEGRDAQARYYNYLDRPAFEAAYAQAGDWRALDIIEYIGGGFGGTTGPWIAGTYQKPRA
ncbi:class I SAM-dependent methyltransferase [Pseudoprimorskyibacter insulae]|uniref:Ubiquinone biosynthesis O-methyltransferase n=1 Tax=Pseudoprimorskyibacter insulae TaxID=1695997 RepID=A0A2R8AWJ1_9RHOB|nr:class I SAM-dependent methyltransferase [Pseudoprimorskyibacter insulae]SPF80234.1 Ubiquinone biosynthesis O-methyltransferase [Pseudoprimorskyibacter insulae]